MSPLALARHRQRSIRGRLVTLLVTTTLLAFFSFILAFLAFQRNALRQDLVHSLQTQAAVASQAVAADLDFGTTFSGTQSLTNLATNTHIQAVRIFNREGQPFATHVSPNHLRPLPEWVESTPGPLFVDGMVELYLPVVQEGTFKGTLFIRSDTTEIQTRFWWSAKLMTAVSLALLGLVLLASARLQKRISGPLLELAETTRRVNKEHDYGIRLKVDEGGEFGALAEAFNGMLAGIQERDEQFRNLFEHMTGGFMLLEVLFDPNGNPVDHRLLAANSEFEQMLGLKRSEELGRTSTELSFQWPADVAQAYYEVAMGGEPVHWERFNDSLQRYYDARVFSPRKGQFAMLFIDITERKQAENEKAKLEAQLQQSQKMESLGVLAGGVAHDMNNVLGAILGLSSAHLDMHPDGSPTHRAFTTIFKAAIRGGSLVKSLLTFARQSPAEDRELDVNTILREEVTLLERTTLSKINLELDLEKALRPIRGDESALTHAFMNLCVNAVDAMPDNGTLSLRTRNVDNDWIEVRVEDTGTGMPKEVLEKALDPFFTTKGVGKGTGLGLSMVFATVKAHHGQLDIQSEVGHGTHIRMRFPACATLGEVAVAIPEPGMATHQGLLKVYLVEDDELFQSSTRALLEMLGHTTTTASSGEEALATLGTGFQPDVVILDVNMPGLGGAGTLPRLRALWPDLPVLLATGRVDQAALDLAAAHPNVTLLSKPFSIKELQQHLDAFHKEP